VRVFFLSFPLGFSLFAFMCGAAWGAGSGHTFAVPVEEQRGWVRVSPGIRPVYVGIHGGTAPVSLRVAPDGSIIAVTGHSGNDFTKIIHSQPPSGAVVPDFSTGASALAVLSKGSGQGASAALLPVGLDVSGSDFFAHNDRPGGKTAGHSFKPLKLGSYKRVLRRPGSV
jgi:hypothetical protein